MKRSDDFTVGETEKPDTIFQFGYSDDPNSVCSFCGSTSGLFCLTKEAAAECSADAETVALRSKPRPMTREQVIERIAQAFKAESGEECERSLAETGASTSDVFQSSNAPRDASHKGLSRMTVKQSGLK